MGRAQKDLERRERRRSRSRERRLRDQNTMLQQQILQQSYGGYSSAPTQVVVLPPQGPSAYAAPVSVVQQPTYLPTYAQPAYSTCAPSYANFAQPVYGGYSAFPSYGGFDQFAGFGGYATPTYLPSASVVTPTFF
eukprot:NODE_6166_length_564_cov_60.462243_g6001_i0.p1 GENE.NODE_6166_length_564_cov_60.462243_g6001_i0~~NODE_6166_length_564_cov_60.462243_g6001_i0.p1  ORF type:complete len:155 (+),score=13.35 NODE_6166_length_564_cov_60.462243_g6001_i0:61-465(+)